MVVYQTVPLREICESIEYGFTASATSEPVGPRFLRITDIVPERLDWETVPFCEIEPKKWAKHRLRTGDIVIARTGATTGWAKFIEDPPEAVFASYLVRVRPAPSVDARFVGFVIESPVYKHFIQQHMGGAAQPNANAQVLTSYEIPLPPLPVQRRIAGILSAYDDLIENSQRRIRILEQMARALYREWFVHFRFPGHKNHPRVASPIGDIPKGWQATTLGSFVSDGSVTLQTGPFGTQLKASHYSDAGTPVINVRNIGFGSLRPDKLEYLPPQRVDEHKRHKLSAGDIVFGRKGAVERHLLVSPNEDGWIQGSDCIRLRVEHGPLKARFLSVAFREEEHQRWMMNQCSSGATMASLNQDILCRIPLALPPSHLVEMFEGFASSALNQAYVLSAQIQNLRQTRDLLLPRLLSGQVSLREN
jgi:type I restriction enzyme S subunit